MTFLQLVQRLRQETNYANTGPTTVVSQTGDHARAVDWVATAYTELQNRHRWRWLRKEFTLNTVSGDNTYAYGDCTDSVTGSAITRFKAWAFKDHLNPVRCYLQSSGKGTEYYLTYVPWEDFRTIYDIASQADASPSHISIDPNDNIVLGPQPNDVYVVSAEYHRSSQVLADNDDTPELPSDYHMLIVYLAMEDFGFYDAAQEVLARAQRKSRRLIRQLESTQLPILRKAGPLA